MTGQGANAALVLPSNSDDLEARIIDVIVSEGLIEREKLTPDATLESLGLTSVDVVHILLGIEDKFGIYLPADASMTETRNVGELVALLTRLLAEKHQA